MYLYSLNEKILYKFSFVALFCVMLLTLDSSFEYFLGYRLIGSISPGASYGRISSFFGDELIMGSFVSKMLPFVLIFLHLNFINRTMSNNIIKISLLIITPLVFFTVYLSGERTAFFNAALFISILILSIPNFKFIQKFFVLLIIYSLISISVLSLKSPQNDRLLDRTIRSFFVIDSANNIKKFNYFSILHEAHYKSAISMFKTNIIFGHGSKMFRELCSKDEYNYLITPSQEIIKYKNKPHNINLESGCSSHPHHFYIQMLAENGVIGFFFLISLLIFFLKNLFNNIKRGYYLFDNKHFPLFIINTSIIIIFNPLVPSMNIFNNWLSAIIYTYLGFYFALSQKLNDQKSYGN